MVAARRDAVGVGEDEIYLQKGEKLTVNQLLEALLIQSANDAAADLADAVAGSQARFVALMNARARELGLTNTHYANPHGLDAPGHYTSALDLTHLARFAMRDPRFAGYVDHYTATIPWAHHHYDRVLVSHNELLEDYPGSTASRPAGPTAPASALRRPACGAAITFWSRCSASPTTPTAWPTSSSSSTGRPASTRAHRPCRPAPCWLRPRMPYHDGKLDPGQPPRLTASLRIGAKVTTTVTAPRSVELPVSQGAVYGGVGSMPTAARSARRTWSRPRRMPGSALLSKVGYQIHRAWHWLTSRL